MKRTFCSLSEADFRAFCETTASGSFLQTAEFAALLTENGWTVEFVALKESAILCVAVLISKAMTGGRHYEVQFGPLSTGDEIVEMQFYQALQRYVKSQGALELLVMPDRNYQRLDDAGAPLTAPDDAFVSQLTALGYTHAQLTTGYNARGESVWHYVKDLEQLTEKNLLKSYSKNGQYSVKLVKKFGVSVAPLTFEELGEFKTITAETSERLSYSDHPLAYYQSFYKNFGENAEFLGAKLNFKAYSEHLNAQIAHLSQQIEKSQHTKKIAQTEELKAQKLSHEKRLEEAQPFVLEYGDAPVLLAAGLFVYGKTEAVYLYSGSYAKFKRFYAPFAIQDFVMRKCLEKGISRYNFFGIQGLFDGSDGVLGFKQNFGGYAVEKTGYFWYYPRPLKRAAIRWIKKLTGRQ